MWLVNGEANGHVSPLDRGLAYGDGVFRTLKVLAHKPTWWADHYAKLAYDCSRLSLACPDEDVLLREIRSVMQTDTDAIVKIMITRGPGARGYAMPQAAKTTRIVMAGPLPKVSDPKADIQVRWCKLQLARQAQLAGIKHLNRLENVLARQEWTDPAIIEGLLCDDTGAVIGGTRSNLFAMRDGVLLSPDLTFSGVAGVTRARVIRAAKRHGVEVQVGRLDVDNILTADEVFLSNSIVGLWRVAVLDNVLWQSTAWTEQFRQWIDETD